MSTSLTELTRLCGRVKAFLQASADEAAFDALALEVFEFQFEHDAPYRSFCLRSGKTPGNAADWNDIPGVVTSAFKELDLTVLPPNARRTVFHSSGTTQHKPSRHFHSEETLRLYEESLLAWFKPHVLPELERADFLVLTPASHEAPHSSLAHMFGVVSERFANQARFAGSIRGDGSWDLDFSALEPTDLPQVICGTAFSFVHWCDELDRRGESITFPAGSRVFETGGYKGRSRTVPKAELHRIIEERLGIPQTHIVSEYGMSELSSQAYDRVCGATTARVFRFPHWARAVVISPESRREANEGEPGLLRVYDLANVGSVMAIQTEDMAVKRGDGFELIGRAAEAEARGCSLMEARS